MANKVDAKVVLLGKEYSGKTCLVERYIHGRFNMDIPYQNVSKYVTLTFFDCGYFGLSSQYVVTKVVPRCSTLQPFRHTYILMTACVTTEASGVVRKNFLSSSKGLSWCTNAGKVFRHLTAFATISHTCTLS